MPAPKGRKKQMSCNHDIALGPGRDVLEQQTARWIGRRDIRTRAATWTGKASDGGKIHLVDQRANAGELRLQFSCIHVEPVVGQISASREFGQ